MVKQLQVNVTYYSRQLRTPGGRPASLSLPEGARVAELLATLAQGEQQLEASEALMVMVNGRRAEPDTPLRDGDSVYLFDHMTGG